MTSREINCRTVRLILEEGGKDRMNQKPTFGIFGIEIERSAVIGLATLAGLIVLAWIIGPVAMMLAWLIQRWAAAESWSARSRWGSIARFACVFGVIAVILFASIYISIPVLTPWIAFIWEHLPARWDTTLHMTVIRWSTLLGLAPFLAIAQEYVHPRTIWYPPHRSLLETERVQLEEESKKKQDAARIRAEQAAKKKAQSTTSTPSTPTPQSQATARDRLVTTMTAPPVQGADTSQEKHVELDQVQADPGQQTVPATPDKQQTTTPAPQHPSTPLAPEQRATPTVEPPAPKKRNWDQGDGSLKDL